MSDLLKATENQVIRNQLLELLREAGPDGANEKVIGFAMRKAGYPADPGRLRENLYYLEKKGLLWVAKCENQALGIHMDVFVITPDGMDVLEGTAQAPGIGVGSYGG